mgnify:CR=1 FL=1
MSSFNAVKAKSPIGEFSWVTVSGQGKLNYNKDGYVYQVVQTIHKDVAAPFIAEIDAVLDQCPKDLKIRSRGYKPVWKALEDHDNLKAGQMFVETDDRRRTDKDELTDFYMFSYQTKTTFSDGKTKEIGVYNSKGHKVDLGERLVGNGSMGRVSCKIKPYVNGRASGVSLYLNGIQITKFVEFQGDSFDALEGDFDGFDNDDLSGDFTETQTSVQVSKEDTISL